MGQVPDAAVNSVGILLVGDGRLATALAAQMRTKLDSASLKERPAFERWARRSSNELSSVIRRFNPTHIWLAISDSAVREFAITYAADFADRTVVHFAGSLSRMGDIWSAHPLTTFSAQTTLSPAEFSQIPFVIDDGGPSLSSLLPGFANPSYPLKPGDRAYYHALCAISGNFTVMLWEAVGRRFQTDLGLPPAVLDLYRGQIFENLKTASARSTEFGGGTPASVLTGPIARGDLATIEAHQESLRARSEDSLLKVYQSFVELHAKEPS